MHLEFKSVNDVFARTENSTPVDSFYSSTTVVTTWWIFIALFDDRVLR